MCCGLQFLTVMWNYDKICRNMTKYDKSMQQQAGDTRAGAAFLVTIRITHYYKYHAGMWLQFLWGNV